MIVDKEAPRFKFGIKPLIAILAAVVVVATVAWRTKLVDDTKRSGKAHVTTGTITVIPQVLQIEFEKVQASTEKHIPLLS